MGFQNCEQCAQQKVESELLFSSKGMICENCHEQNEKAENAQFGLRTEDDRIQDSVYNTNFIWVILIIGLVLSNVLSVVFEWGLFIY